ncbi:uncharacterized protein LOC144078709 [Stigmatopora argus]
MKLSLVVLLLLDITGTSSVQIVEEFGDLSLRLDYPPFYRSNIKSCCKVYFGGCFTLFDSTGFTASFLTGRVSIVETDRWIEFKLARVQAKDGGYYRCFLQDAPFYIKNELLFHVLGASADQSRVRTERPKWTDTEPEQEHSNPPTRTFWTCGTIVVFTVSAIVVVAFIIGILCYRINTKTKCLDKYGKTMSESAKEDATEISAVIYTTVDFQTSTHTPGTPGAEEVFY